MTMTATTTTIAAAPIKKRALRVRYDAEFSSNDIFVWAKSKMTEPKREYNAKKKEQRERQMRIQMWQRAFVINTLKYVRIEWLIILETRLFMATSFAYEWI